MRRVSGKLVRTSCAISAICAAVASLAGCGLGAAHGGRPVSLTLTSDFGRSRIASFRLPHLASAATVMQVLRGAVGVQASGAGDRVQAIDGVVANGGRLRWLYYVNGVAVSTAPARTSVHGGDRIWWDLHGSSGSDPAPAVVGSFPEPFLDGVGGKRLPTAVECATDTGQACSRVSARLAALGIPAGTQQIGTGSGTDSLAVVVGTWRDLRGEIVARLINQGPGASGVYARFAGRGGASLQLLDPNGRVARTLGAGAGLIAATATSSSAPTWLITGTDVAGVSSAAAALTPSRLRDHFAVAVQGGTGLPVPVRATN